MAERRVTLVCGPPCAGKSTWVAERAQPGDIVLCYDTLAQELGSPVPWGHAGRIAWRTEHHMRRREAGVAEMDEGVAWVIRSMAGERRRRERANELGAELLLINPGREVCMARAAQRPDPEGTRAAISKWFELEAEIAGARSPAEAGDDWANARPPSPWD